jgi:hypothetical protein
MITLPKKFDEVNCSLTNSVKFDVFPGGAYMTTYTSLKHLRETWMLMEKWRKEAKKQGNINGLRSGIEKIEVFLIKT